MGSSRPGLTSLRCPNVTVPSIPSASPSPSSPPLPPLRQLVPLQHCDDEGVFRLLSLMTGAHTHRNKVNQYTAIVLMSFTDLGTGVTSHLLEGPSSLSSCSLSFLPEGEQTFEPKGR